MDYIEFFAAMFAGIVCYIFVKYITTKELISELKAYADKLESDDKTNEANIVRDAINFILK